LEITTTSGDKLILDGTPDQYDWHEGGWIIPKATAERHFMLGPIMWLTPTDAEKESMNKALQETNLEDFKALYDRAHELLEGFNWESLMELEEEAMSAEVAEEARRKFKNVCSRYCTAAAENGSR
jgi:hypothetical protein